jgi:4-hydroxy 2-oxovalerate aldolase
MKNLYVLDCTLRDGGYINNWKFGKENIHKIISKLIDANIDIIECGYLTNKQEYDLEYSQYNTIERIKEFLPSDHKNSLFVVMINYGEYNIDEIPYNDETSIDGIRVVFHKDELEEAMLFSKAIAKKGYKLFIQPMVSLSYSDEEFLHLIKYANSINPYAFYIVDSFGVMKRNDLLRFYYLVDHNLDSNIYVGFHSHNNLQLAYSNAQALSELKTNRKLIIDSSVFGMGRGAGNLNTELFIDFLNDINGENYKAKPLLQIIDQVLAPVYSNNFWGYSLPHYISALHNCHPNYASFLDDKNTLVVESINDILSGLDEKKKNSFDKTYIETLYNEYQSKRNEDNSTRLILEKDFKNKIVVIIAPGSSINYEKEKITKAINEADTITISVNFVPDEFNTDYIFISNLRRYNELDDDDKLRKNLIITSNIKVDHKQCYILDYTKLLNNVEAVKDNATMMLIKLLIELDVKRIKLAGLDGYSHDIYTNFTKHDMEFMKKSNVMDAMNMGMSNMLLEFSKKIKIEFITGQKYVKLKE